MSVHLPFAINVTSAVSLVFINRHLMSVCAFHYVGILAALHMAVTAAVALHQVPLSTQKVVLSRSETLFFMVVTLLSMVSMNLSLLFNDVSVYQITKIAMIPACCFLEYIFQGKLLTRSRALAIAAVMAGVLTACVLACFLFSTAKLLSPSGRSLAFLRARWVLLPRPSECFLHPCIMLPAQC